MRCVGPCAMWKSLHFKGGFNQFDTNRIWWGLWVFRPTKKLSGFKLGGVKIRFWLAVWTRQRWNTTSSLFEFALQGVMSVIFGQGNVLVINVWVFRKEICSCDFTMISVSFFRINSQMAKQLHRAVLNFNWALNWKGLNSPTETFLFLYLPLTFQYLRLKFLIISASSP